MRFLVDAQLPPALARWLAAEGHRAEHVGDLGMQAATAAAIVTKDEDFARRRVMSGDGPAMVWLRLPNTRRRDLLAWFAAVLPNVLDALARGETLIEIT